MQIDEETIPVQPAHRPALQGLDFSTQGAAPLEQYLKHADGIMQPVEAQAIKNFVNGMHINHQREIVRSQLKVRKFV